MTADTLPNFIIFGMPRCGSTALQEYLRQHPDVFMSDPKEPHFFSLMGDRPTFAGPGDDVMINDVAITSLAAYRDLFRSAGGRSAVGEASVEYGYFPVAAERMRQLIPGVKLVCLLRNPADRAFSAFSFMRGRLFEPHESFEDALADEDRRIAANWHFFWHYRRMGLYHLQLAHYYAAFGPDRIRVFLFEDFLREPRRVARAVFQFLEIDPNVDLVSPGRMVASGTPRSPGLQRLLMIAWQAKAVLRPLLPVAIQRSAWRRLNSLNLRQGSFDPATRTRLLDFYSSDIRATGELIGRDLSAWR